MPRTKKVEEKKEGARDSVTLRVKQGVPQGPLAGTERTFSLEAHGEKFEDRAKEWAERFNAEEV